jgi:hypothetical protein
MKIRHNYKFSNQNDFFYCDYSSPKSLRLSDLVNIKTQLLELELCKTDSIIMGCYKNKN